MRRFTVVLACLSLLLLPLLTHADNDDLVRPEGTTVQDIGARGKKKIKNQYIVMLKEDQDVDTVTDMIVKKHKGMLIFKYKDAFKGFAANLSDEKVAELQADPRVAAVMQDEEVTIVGKNNDVTAQAQTLATGVDRVNAENKTNKGANIEVAIIDTGIDAGHPDLAGAVLGGISCIPGENNPLNDGNGHGTHVAGIVGARQNTIGVVGVAPDVKLWAVKVLNKQGSGTWSQVICGINWVKSQASHIKVANMSLGGGGSATPCNGTDALHTAICNLVSAGVTVVVAAGNDGGDMKNFVPAAYPEVIAVTALADSNGKACGGGVATSYGPDDTFATFSNYATTVTDKAHAVAAPGVNINSLWKGNTYNTISGTSMASPHVAGAAALWIKTHPGNTPAQVLAGLKGLAEPGDVNFKTECAGTTKSHTATSLHPEAVLRAEGL